MKPRANYKYMDTRMLIGLAMFQIEDQPMVSCFLLEVVLLVGTVRNNPPIVIYCDNISSILLANNPVYHARTKHIEVHYHFIREKVLAK